MALLSSSIAIALSASSAGFFNATTTDSDPFQTWLMVFLGLAALIWMTLAFFAMWRARRLGERAATAEDKALLADQVLRSDDRRPIWVWADGRCRLDQATLSLLGSVQHITTLKQLEDHLRAEPVTHGGANISVADMMAMIDSETSQDLDFAIKVHHTDKSKLSSAPHVSLLITVTFLPGLGMQFPDRLIWLTPLSDYPEDFAPVRGAALSGQHLLLGADYRAAYHNLPVPTAVLDRSGKLLDVNNAYTRAVEASSVDAVTSEQIQLTEQPPKIALDRVFMGHTRARERQFGLIRQDRRSVMVNIQRLSADKAVAVYIDVSGEEEAQLEITRLLDSQTETLNRLRTPVAIFGSDKILRFFNAAFSRLSNLEADWLRSNIDHADLLDAMRANRRIPELIDYQTWKTKNLDVYTRLIEAEEEMWHLPNGTTYRVVSQPYPFGGILILFEDITDKLVLERSYNTLIAVQRETLNNLKDAVAVFAEDTSLRLSNRVFDELWDLPEYQLDRLPSFRDLAHAIARKPVRFLTNDGQPYEISRELPVCIANRQSTQGRFELGEDRFFDFALTSLPDGGSLWALTDRSESARAERALIERNAALETAERMRTAFITSVSYELRTPLNAITGFAELLRLRVAGDLQQKQEEYVENILEAADGLKTMISDVLDLAVLQAGQVSLATETVDAAGFMRETAQIAADLCTQSEVTLVQQGDTSGAIHIDPRRLKQAVLNMVSCMVDIIPRGEVLTFNGRASGDQLILSLKAQSCGPNSALRDGLVQALRQGGTPAGRRATGINLALANTIIELHGGGLMIAPLDMSGLIMIADIPINAVQSETPDQVDHQSIESPLL